MMLNNFEHSKMVRLQADQHEVISSDGDTVPPILHAMHKKNYETARTLLAGKSILDIGCNSGYGTSMLAPAASRIAGVDVSTNAIAVARQNYSGVGIDFRQTSGSELPFDNQSFDAVVSFQVIEHIVDTKLYLSEIQRVLKPDGILLLATPNSILRVAPGMAPYNRFHVREYSGEELRKQLSPFFTHIHVLGMFAEEEIYRCQRGLFIAARDRIANYRHDLSKGIILYVLLRIIRRMAAFVKRKPDNHSFKPEDLRMERFFYKDNDDDNALDLFALASNSELTSFLAKLEFSQPEYQSCKK